MRKHKHQYSPVSMTLDPETLEKLSVIAKLAGGQSVSAVVRYTIAELYRIKVKDGIIEKPAA